MPISSPIPAAREALDQAGITVKKNAIPFDQRPPTRTSGIRVGTPALTTRGMKEKEMVTSHYPLFAEEWTAV